MPCAKYASSGSGLRLSHSNTATEFGDISLALKRVLYRDCCRVVSAGLSMTFPTGSDATFNDGGGNILSVENNAYHLQPFIGMVTRPNNRTFVQTIAQVDFDTSGYDFNLNNATFGDINDPTVLYLGGSIGYWMYRSCCCCDRLQGIAPILEIHYTTTLETPDVDPNNLVAFRDGNSQRQRLS